MALKRISYSKILFFDKNLKEARGVFETPCMYTKNEKRILVVLFDDF